MCGRTTRMRFKKGSKVEVFGRKEVPSGSWYSAEIVHGNGHYYTIKYDGETSVPGVESLDRVPRKAIRPCPPVIQAVEDWVSGDVVEVFHGFSWKVATVLRALPMDWLLVRLLVGSPQELKVKKGDVRPRLCWQDDIWKVIGKVSSNCEERQYVPLKLRCNFNSQQMETTASTCYKNSYFQFGNINNIQEICTTASQSLKRKLTNRHSPELANAMRSKRIRKTGKDNKLNQFPHPDYKLKPIMGWKKVDRARLISQKTHGADSIASSVASCSISGKNNCKVPENNGIGLFEDNNEYNSDAESCCRMGSEKGNALLPADEKVTDEIHRIELQAYRSTIEALHASGPLSWEQETLLTNLRDSLHITNDEHLMELRNLVSPPTCIPNS